MRRAAAIFAAVLLCSVQVRAGDSVCEHLSAFVGAPFPASPDEKAAPRSVTFVWLPGEILNNVECEHRDGDMAGKAFCAWLIDNTNQEFSEVLPDDVLRCHGFGFPPAPNARDWKASYNFLYEHPNRNLLLEVRLGSSEGYNTIRLTAFPDGRDVSTDPLPPLQVWSDASP